MCIKKLYYVAIVSMGMLGSFSESFAQEGSGDRMDQGREEASDTDALENDLNSAMDVPSKEDKNPAKEETTDLAASRVIAVSFEKESSKLSENGKTKIRDLLNNTTQAGAIREVVVAAWSDKPYSAGDKALDQKDGKLAKSRLQAVRDFLSQESPSLDVSGINMAQPSALYSDLFRTREWQLKKSASDSKESTASGDTEDGILGSILAAGQVGHVVVALDREQPGLSE